MNVHVRLYATLAQRIPAHLLPGEPRDLRAGTTLHLSLAEGSTVGDLIARLQLPEAQVRVAFVNAKARPLDFSLSPGDEIALFPPVGGG
jgi:molybdopterin synthase sulfur carrier subunit